MEHRSKVEFSWVGSYYCKNWVISSVDIHCDDLKISANIDTSLRSDREQNLTLNYKDNEGFKQVKCIKFPMENLQKMTIDVKGFKKYTNPDNSAQETLIQKSRSFKIINSYDFIPENVYRIVIVHEKNKLKTVVNDIQDLDKIDVLKSMELKGFQDNYVIAQQELTIATIECDNALENAKKISYEELQRCVSRKNQLKAELKAIEKEINSRKCIIF